MLVRKDFFLMDVKVVAISKETVTIELSAPEKSPKSTLKNERGDGLDLHYYDWHTVRLRLSKPTERLMAGHIWHVFRAYVITQDAGVIDGVPTFDAEPEDNGGPGTIVRDLNDVHGPSAEFINTIEAQVMKEEQAASKRLAAKSPARTNTATSKP